MYYIGLFLYIYVIIKTKQNPILMKTIINTLKNDSEAVLKIASGIAGLAVAAFSTFVIVTRLF